MDTNLVSLDQQSTGINSQMSKMIDQFVAFKTEMDTNMVSLSQQLTTVKSQMPEINAELGTEMENKLNLINLQFADIKIQIQETNAQLRTEMDARWDKLNKQLTEIINSAVEKANVQWTEMDAKLVSINEQFTRINSQMPEDCFTLKLKTSAQIRTEIDTRLINMDSQLKAEANKESAKVTQSLNNVILDCVRKEKEEEDKTFESRLDEMKLFATTTNNLNFIKGKWPHLSLVFKYHPVAAMHAIRDAIKGFYRDNYEIKWNFTYYDGDIDPKSPNFLDKMRDIINKQPLVRKGTGQYDSYDYNMEFRESYSSDGHETAIFGSLEIDRLVLGWIREDIMRNSFKMYREKLPNWQSEQTAKFEINYSNHRTDDQVVVFWQTNGWIQARDFTDVYYNYCSFSGSLGLMAMVLDMQAMNLLEANMKMDVTRENGKEFKLESF